MKRIIGALVALLLATSTHAQLYPLFGPANGVLKGNSTTPQTSAATNPDIISLWSGTCNSSTFLRGDGSCTAATGAPFLDSAGSFGSNPPTIFGSSANIGAVTSVPAGTSQSFTPFVAQNTNSGGYVGILLAGNGSTSLNADPGALPNTGHCCNVPTGSISGGMYYFGTAVTLAQFISAQPVGPSMWLGTSGSGEPLCLGTFAHCILSLDGVYGSMFVNQASGDTVNPPFKLRGNQGTGTIYTADISSGASPGSNYGVRVQASYPTSSGGPEYALKIESATLANLFSVNGDGVILSNNGPTPHSFTPYNMQTGAQGGFSLPNGTGFTTDPVNFNTQIAKSGPIICLTFNGATATSNSNNFTITSLPADFVGLGSGTIVLEDNGTIALGSWQKSGSTFTFSVGLQPGATGTFTNSGTKGIPYAQTICFHDN